MVLYIILGALFIVVVLIVVKRKSLVKKHYEKAQKDFETYKPQIDAFLETVENLKINYTSKQKGLDIKFQWKYLYEQLSHIIVLQKDPLFIPKAEFENVYSNFDKKVKDSNQEYIYSMSREYDDLLSNVDGKSLDMQQREVVISDEDKTLVIAGAGSGKTLTIAAKVKFLCDVNHIKPNDILLISFTNKSASEMTERIQNKMGIPVTATTFHKLGLDIITESTGKRPDVFDGLNTFVHNFFENELLNYPELIRNLTEYFTYYLEIPADMNECQNLGTYYEVEKSADLETLKSKYEREKYIERKGEEAAKKHFTLKGELVKSLEETKIANFLFMHGVNYEYERLYPFESDDPKRKAYRPDFYLLDYDIYLEHFGITRDYKCPWLSKIEEEKYIDSINWKREFHKENGTKLIETYSFNMKEGTLFERLDMLLKQNKVEYKEREFTDIFETIYEKKSNKYFSEFIKLCCTFITLFKSANNSIEKISEFKRQNLFSDNEFKKKRADLFLSIIKIILNEYQKYLEKNGAIDFSDMINDAAKRIQNGFSIHQYKYVIVDEYQDISLSRFKLLKAIIDQTGAKILCVGDDWQSIYRFAGSDITLFTDFKKYFGYTNLLKIEKTYRNSQQLINQASRFVMQNQIQLRKQLSSDIFLDYPLVFWGYDDEPAKSIKGIVNKIISEFGPEKSILFLGRTNFDIDILEQTGLFEINQTGGEVKLKYISSPNTPVQFLSVHKSKGLEADNVVLINFKNDKLGFPNQITDDQILNLVLTTAEKYNFAEERRLFYVAITRTKNRTFILTDNKNPSLFFREFMESKEVCFVNIVRHNDKSLTVCPRCKTGELLKVKWEKDYFVGCSNFPRCTYTLHDATLLNNPKKCPACGGFLIKRKGKNNHYFTGCTNYPYCEYTEEIKREI